MTAGQLRGRAMLEALPKPDPVQRPARWAKECTDSLHRTTCFHLFFTMILQSAWEQLDRRLAMDERKALRVVADLRVKAHVRGRSFSAVMYDLSQAGCMIELPEAGLQISDNLLLSDSGFESGGYVVWEHRGYAGVKFYRELDPVLVAQLGFKPSETPFPDDRTPEPFGTPLAPFEAASGVSCSSCAAAD